MTLLLLFNDGSAPETPPLEVSVSAGKSRPQRRLRIKSAPYPKLQIKNVLVLSDILLPVKADTVLNSLVTRSFKNSIDLNSIILNQFNINYDSFSLLEKPINKETDVKSILLDNKIVEIVAESELGYDNIYRLLLMTEMYLNDE